MMRRAPPSPWIEGEAVAEHEDTLRRLSVRDDEFVEQLLGDGRTNETASRLDGKTHALVRVAALVALDAAPPSYMAAICAAQRFGASRDEIVGCLVAVIPVVGAARVVSAAPKVGLALGYDVEAALETHLSTA